MSIFLKNLYEMPYTLFRKNKNLKNVLGKGNYGLNLYNVISNGYKDEATMENFGKSKGYILDKDLSSKTEQFYYNPETNKMLMNIRGTASLDDIKTDFQMLRGKLKETDRYKQADTKLKQAREKYKDYDRTITSHSLGGAISERIATPDERVISLNKADLGGKRKNHIDIRTTGDLVSSYGLLGNHYHVIGKGRLDNPLDWFTSHKAGAIKDLELFI